MSVSLWDRGTTEAVLTMKVTLNAFRLRVLQGSDKYPQRPVVWAVQRHPAPFLAERAPLTGCGPIILKLRGHEGSKQ